MADDRTHYWMDGNDFGDFGDGGGGGDFGDDGGGGGFDDNPDDQDFDDQGEDDDQGDGDDDQPDDDGGDDDDGGEDGDGDNGDGGDGDEGDGGDDDGGDGGDDGDNGDDGDGGGDDDNNNFDDEDQDPNEKFASEDDLASVDDDVFASADDFPNADESDFEDDTGDWTADDYQESAQNLFGDHEFFGDTLITQKTDEGFQPYTDPRFAHGFDEIAPGTSDSVHLFERDGKLFAFGLVSQAVLAALLTRYNGIDLSGLEVATPDKGEITPPEPLPPAFANTVEKASVDMRKYCSPVGDQGQTGRCSAFAWTHGTEMARNIVYNESQQLSPNFTMLQFQRMQGEAKDYEYAYSGGNGTINGPEPGKVMVKQGTCQQDLWPDDETEPRAGEADLTREALRFRLDATPLPIAMDDVKKVLSAGSIVHVSMNTGEAFSDIGRDGLFDAAEAPSGRHGRHAMLLVGYTGNFFIVKNSWGTDWGDQGYCYIPKNVLAASDPEFIAILLTSREGT